ncbi:MAG TPA: hypothetical protein VKZ81_22880 [Pseudonocardia sp.]|jgi:hypothetical protein|uniref:hypothetical protein n=1 Tax=Pseudonocardia sp. TaxID=60912 RepID=UPI002B4B855F|nr:hypothetical protein [Pseudonocardia sp.]HLU58315.1 hypothetical protein [Pseudonocardia sp.]
MWAFLSARLRWWLILAIGAPLLGWVLGRIGDVIESRRGPNALSRVLQTARGWLRRRSRGPLARRAGDPASVRDTGAPRR